MNVPQPRKLVKVNQIKEYFKISAHFQTYVRVSQPSRKIAKVISFIMAKLETAKKIHFHTGNFLLFEFHLAFFCSINLDPDIQFLRVCLIFFRVRVLKTIKLYILYPKKLWQKPDFFFLNYMYGTHISLKFRP